MDADTLAWVVFISGLFLVWSLVYARTGSFRKSTLASLVLGKTFALAYRLAGLDKTILTLYLVNRATGAVRPIPITACELLFAAFLASFLVILYTPVIQKHLPAEVRQSLEELKA